MIKLFGWENKMSKQLDIRREEELGWLWKIKVCLNHRLLHSINIINTNRFSNFRIRY